jgi:UDP-N-acetylmuramate: L-alanyl-gamma-D-glutamyl-meso-diaminopimelate ligase
MIENGVTTVIIDNEKTDLRIFGNHNLLNLQAAYYVCKEVGMADAAFAHGIATFEGAAKRLELIAENNDGNIYRDFAHAPSKVKASINAVKQQFPQRKLIAILELHTFSSLNKNFMEEYKGTMENADEAIVFYSKHALELKRMEFLDPQSVKDGFQKQKMEVITDRIKLEEKLKGEPLRNTNFLFMSSGNYDGMDILTTLNIQP